MVTAKSPAKRAPAKRPAAEPKAAATKPKPPAKAKPATKPAPGVAPAPSAKVAKPVAPKPARPRAGKPAPIPAEQRRCYVEVAAYHIAERRGFAPGDPLVDWLEAEAEIDRLLAQGLLGN